MYEVATAIRQGASEVDLFDSVFRVYWHNEPGDDNNDQPKFSKSRMIQLYLRPTDKDLEPLSFFSPTREGCVKHLEGYIQREAA